MLLFPVVPWIVQRNDVNRIPCKYRSFSDYAAVGLVESPKIIHGQHWGTKQGLQVSHHAASPLASMSRPAKFRVHELFIITGHPISSLDEPFTGSTAAVARLIGQKRGSRWGLKQDKMMIRHASHSAESQDMALNRFRLPGCPGLGKQNGLRVA